LILPHAIFYFRQQESEREEPLESLFFPPSFDKILRTRSSHPPPIFRGNTRVLDFRRTGNGRNRHVCSSFSLSLSLSFSSGRSAVRSPALASRNSHDARSQCDPPFRIRRGIAVVFDAVRPPANGAVVPGSARIRIEEGGGGGGVMMISMSNRNGLAECAKSNRLARVGEHGIPPFHYFTPGVNDCRH